MNRKLSGIYFLSAAALAVGIFGAGCDDKSPLGGDELLKQCGLVCSDQHVADGYASISGVASLDAFFGSVVRFNGAASGVTDGIRGELDAIALSVGLKAGASGADIKAKVAAQIAANVDGSLTIKAEPPKCSVTAKATLEAQAQCDVDVDPGSATVKCEGSCDVQAGAQVDCGADATVTCTVTDPSVKCDLGCKGTCQLDVAAKCEGTCHGDCTGTCSVKDASGQCAGSCSGTCKGSCELAASGSCSGSCHGSCSYTPPSGKCDASAQAHCSAKAGASVDCKGSCSGSVTPPSAKAECQASAKADASVNAEGTPPSLNVTFQLKATVAADATASAKFTAWLEGFKGHVSALVALQAKAQGLATAATDLAGSAEGAVKGSITDLQAKGGLDLKTTVGLGCALSEVPNAIALVKSAGEDVTTNVQGAVTVLGSVGLGS